MSEFSEFAKPRDESRHDKEKSSCLALFFAALIFSGLSALIYEVAWQRVLVRLTGATVPATCLTLSLFMVGLAAGAILVRLLFFRQRLNLAALSLIEIILCICGLVSMQLANDDILKTWAASYPPFLILTGLLLVPTTLMGATLPIALGELSRVKQTNAKRERGYFLACLYAGNTFGALAGALLTGFLLLPQLGIGKAILTGALVNLLSAGCFFFVHKNTTKTIDADTADEVEGDKKNDYKLDFPVPISALISGFAFLSLEVLWTRFLINLFGSTVYAFTAVTSVCLFGLSAGAILAATLTDNKSLAVGPGYDKLARLLCASALTVAISLYCYNQAPALYLYCLQFFYPIWADGSNTYIAAMLAVTSLVVLLPCLVMGLVLPFCLIIASPSKNLRDSTSVILAFNLIGCALGAIFAYCLFLAPFVGAFQSPIQTGTIAIAIIWALAAINIYACRSSILSKRPNLVLPCTLVLLVVTISARPAWDTRLFSSAFAYLDLASLNQAGVESTLAYLTEGKHQEKILAYYEGAGSTICVKLDQKNNSTYLIRNGKVEARIPFNSSRPSPLSDLPTHVLLGQLPSLFCRSESQEVLQIGYGSGTTSDYLYVLDRVKSIDAVDLEESIFKAARIFETQSPLRSLSGSKINKQTVDARQLLLRSEKKYDLIVSQASEPWVSGAADLYSREFFALLKSRLKEGGVFCQWLQLYSISQVDFHVLLRTIQANFPDSYIWQPANAGEIIVLCLPEKTELDLLMLEGRLRKSRSRMLLSSIGISSADELLANLILFPQDIKELVSGSDLLDTDDNLYLEFALANRGSPCDRDIDAILSTLTAKKNSDPDYYSTPKIALALAERALYMGRFESDPQLVDHFLPINEKTPPVDRKLPFEAKRSQYIIAKDFPQNADAIIYGARARQILSPSISNLPVLDKAYRMLEAKNACSSKSAMTRLVYSGYLIERKEVLPAARILDELIGSENLNVSEIIETGFLYLLANRNEKALLCFERALAQNSDSKEALSGLGLSGRLAGLRHSRYEEALKQSLSIDANQMVARYALAQALYENGKIALSLEQMAETERLSSTNPWPHLFIACILEKQEKFDLLAANLSRLKKRMTMTANEDANSIFMILDHTAATNLNQPDRARQIDQLFFANHGVHIDRTLSDKIVRKLLDSPLPGLNFLKEVVKAR